MRLSREDMVKLGVGAGGLVAAVLLAVIFLGGGKRLPSTVEAGPPPSDEQLKERWAGLRALVPEALRADPGDDPMAKQLAAIEAELRRRGIDPEKIDEELVRFEASGEGSRRGP